MTEKRLDGLTIYFRGSLNVLKQMKEKHPDQFGKNSDIAVGIFEDTLNILDYLKTFTHLSEIKQTEVMNEFDNLLTKLIENSNSENLSI